MHACGGDLRLRSGYSGLVVYTTNQRAAQRTTSGDMDARISGNGGFNVGHINASMFNVGPLKCCQSVTHAGHRDVETLRRKKKKRIPRINNMPTVLGPWIAMKKALLLLIVLAKDGRE